MTNLLFTPEAEVAGVRRKTIDGLQEQIDDLKAELKAERDHRFATEDRLDRAIIKLSKRVDQMMSR